jgi:hypothetical protein
MTELLTMGTAGAVDAHVVELRAVDSSGDWPDGPLQQLSAKLAQSGFGVHPIRQRAKGDFLAIFMAQVWGASGWAYSWSV